MRKTSIAQEKSNNELTSIRPAVRGKFIYCGNEKFYIKGSTYGTFAPDADGVQFPSREIVEQDFHLMAQHGFNSVRTYTVPPLYLLDAAERHNLKVMVGLPWEQHIAFLDNRKLENNIVDRVKASVKSCHSHPAILCYTIGNEIPAQIVRWYGKKRIEHFLRRLYNAVKEVDPHGLVTYVNYPTTEYLDLSFLDFYSFNVYIESPEKLHNYIMRLHNLCNDLPLVLAEIGHDSMRNGEEKQAEVMEWQTKKIFSQGCAGMFVFAWTDEWWRGGHDILDWDFGLVSRDRISKPALHAVSSVMQELPFSADTGEKFISVVVCSYNGSSTIRDCLEGLTNLNYFNYEVIVINDGSTDNFSEIVKEYNVTLIDTPNRGLSNARNLGLSYAKGEIVAYIDDDAYPDPDWLNYLNTGFSNKQFAAIGGPNLVPHEDGTIAKSVACSPGGPVHVLTSDEQAEHIPGCNMAFRRSALLHCGGFDPVFRAAGDDVDVCWRIQDLGYTIGFHPSAIIWHHRRNSVRAYWKQQKGYGKAEALLERKWPERYNALGHYGWNGSIYGNSHTRPLDLKKKRIFYGTWGSALFQSVYDTGTNFLFSIPLMPEWYLVCGLAAFTGILGFVFPSLLWAWLVFTACAGIVVLQAYTSAVRNIRNSRCLPAKNRFVFIVTFLHLIQPAARLYGRFANGLTPWRKRTVVDKKEKRVRLSASKFSYWSETWKAPEDWLKKLERNIRNLKANVKKGGEYDSWDLSSRNDLYVKIRSSLLVEEHGAGKQYLHLKCKAVPSALAVFPAVLFFSIAVATILTEQFYVSTFFFFLLASLLFRVVRGIRNSRYTLFMALQNLKDDAVILTKSDTEENSIMVPGKNGKVPSRLKHEKITD